MSLTAHREDRLKLVHPSAGCRQRPLLLLSAPLLQAVPLRPEGGFYFSLDRSGATNLRQPQTGIVGQRVTRDRRSI
jgi:hypothetical protein